jgi:hypothetical protein
MEDVEQSIRERAYRMWIDGGSQQGHAESHWLAAQREILGELQADRRRARFDRRPRRAGIFE